MPLGFVDVLLKAAQVGLSALAGSKYSVQMVHVQRMVDGGLDAKCVGTTNHELTFGTEMSTQVRLWRMPRKEGALRYRLPRFVLPCPDYAI